MMEKMVMVGLMFKYSIIKRIIKVQSIFISAKLAR